MRAGREHHLVPRRYCNPRDARFLPRFPGPVPGAGRRRGSIERRWVQAGSRGHSPVLLDQGGLLHHTRVAAPAVAGVPAELPGHRRLKRMKRACVIGWPIGHSRSPVIHNYWLAAYGIEGEYTAVPVPPEELKNFLQNLPAAGYVGCNVTIPHKQAAFGYLTVRDPVSRAIGAINTVYIRDGETYGVNTDAPGFISSLVAGAQSAGWQQTPAAVLGAGGAARAIVFALRDAGVPEIRISNRTRSRAEELARAVGPTAVVADWSSRNDVLAGCGLLVNATALGMDGKPPLDIDLAHL